MSAICSAFLSIEWTPWKIKQFISFHWHMYHNLRPWTGHAPWFRDGVSPLLLEMTVFRKACKHARAWIQGSPACRYWRKSYFLKRYCTGVIQNCCCWAKAMKSELLPFCETRHLHQDVVFFDWKVLQGPARPSGPPAPYGLILGPQAPTHPENTQDQGQQFSIFDTEGHNHSCSPAHFRVHLETLSRLQILERPWQSGS